MASIVISEYQFSFFVLLLVGVIGFFNFIFCIDELSNMQNRTINQNDSGFYNSLFCYPYLLIDVYRFSKSIVVDSSYSTVKFRQIGIKRHAEYSLMHLNVHSIESRDGTHPPIRHIPDLSLPNLQHTIQ